MRTALRTFRALVWTLVLVLSLVMTLVASRQPQQAVFRSGVEIFELRVSVLDEERRPVRGLTAANFTLLQDGVEQAIVEFQEVVVPERDGPLFASQEVVAADVESEEFADRRLFVLLLDDFGMPYQMDGGLAQNVLPAREAKRVAREFVQSLGPNDFAAVVLTRDTRYFPDFTNSYNKLIGAIEAFSPPGDAESFYLSQVTRGRVGYLAAMRDLITYLDDLPQLSKTILYVGNPDSVLFDRGTRTSEAASAQDVINLAKDAGVAISGFDVSEWLDRGANSLLVTLAENTGGQAVGLNRLDEGMEQVFEETGTYYVLRFDQSGPEDGKFRRLDVSVNVSRVTVHARRGYTAPEPDDRVEAEMPAFDEPLEIAVSALPDEAVDRRLYAYAAARPGTLTVVAELAAGEASRPAWSDGATVEVTVTGGDGGSVGRVEGRIEAGMRGVRLDVPLAGAEAPTAAMSVRLDVSAEGSALFETTDVRADGTWLGPPLVYRAALQPRAPLEPAAELEFQRTQRIHIEWPVLRAPTQKQARLLRRSGDPTGFSPPLEENDVDGQQLLSIGFPLSSVAPGEYLIEVVAGDEASTERKLVAFRVVQ